jgi:hypothetical protein
MINVLNAPVKDLRIWIVLLMTFLMVVTAGMATPSMPILTMATMAAAALAALLTLGERMLEVFLFSVAVVLTGYAFLGKGFAYIGVPPLYIGEASLGLGVLALLMTSHKHRISGPGILLLGFMVLGVLRTVPFVSTYGIFAVRDAALWYYGAFALILSAFLERRHFEQAVAWLSFIAPALVIWLGITSLLGRFTLPGVPAFPGSPWPLFFVKPGDRAVMLVVAGALVLAGLYRHHSPKRSQFTLPVWTIWLVGTGSVIIMTRGGMLAMGIGLALIFFLRPTRHWVRPTLLASIAITLFIVINPSIPSPYGGRTISPAQLATNVTSLFSDNTTNEGYLDKNKDWRKEWWGAIYGYTFHGPYFWDGKGFGVNLADADGYQIQADGTLRSPHSAHLTVLARMGVPGLFMWIALHLTFLVQLLAAQRRARDAGDMFWANVDVWILSVWLAMLINASFDVYFEGPQGGIWFWAVVGAGFAALRLQAAERRGDQADHVPFRAPDLRSMSPYRPDYRQGSEQTT